MMRKCNDSHIFLSVAVQCGPVHLPVRMSALTPLTYLCVVYPIPWGKWRAICPDHERPTYFNMDSMEGKSFRFCVVLLSINRGCNSISKSFTKLRLDGTASS